MQRLTREKWACLLCPRRKMYASLIIIAIKYKATETLWVLWKRI